MAEIKNNIDKFFSDLSSGATWNVGVSIARKNALPLDNTSVFKSYSELTTYVANGMSYMGQPVAVVNEDGSVDFYVLDANKQPQEVGKATTGDNNSIILDDGVLKLLGFDAAPEGAQLSKGANGKLVWALPDTTTAEGQSAAIAALQAIVNGVVADPENGVEAADGLVKKVADNAKAISDMDAAYKAADATTLSTAKSYTDTSISGLKVSIEQTTNGVEQIVIKSGDTVVSSVDASVFVQDSFLDDVSYNAETGKITFTWKMGDGVSTKTDEIDVSALVDTYTNGTGLTLSNNQFAVDTSVIATVESVGTAVSNASATLTTEINKKANSEDVESEISRIETKIGNDIANAIAAALKVDGKDKYATASDLTTLAGRVKDAEEILDVIEPKAHEHDNKLELDKIADGDVAKWNAAYGVKHEHENKSVLDGISSEKVVKWDAAQANAEQNAKDYTEEYAATIAQGRLADTAVQSLTILGHTLDKNTKTTLTPDEAKTALGLGTAAYANADAFDAKDSAKAVQGDTTKTVKEAYELAASKITGAEVDTKIQNAGHALASDLTTHTSNSTIHVTTDDKQKWNAAVVKLESLTGESLGGGSGSTGGIASMIDTAIDAYDVETVQPAFTTVNTKLDSILGKGTTEEDTGRLGAVEKLAGENAAAIATIKKNVTDNDTDIEKAKSDITALQTASGTHALTTYVDAELAKKADKAAYEATAATVESLKSTVDAFFKEDAAIEGAVDTLHEIAEYIKNDESGATQIASRIGSLEGKVDVEKVSTAISTAVSAEESRALAVEGELSERIDDLEKNTAGYATVTYVDSKATATLTSAETFATTKVTELANGAVKKNTDNIAINTGDITTLKTSKANVGDSYLKAETYTKTEVENLIVQATPEWGTF